MVSGTRLTDATTKDTEETGPGRIQIAAPGMRRLTDMAVREDGGVAQRPLEEKGGPGRVGQLPAQDAREKACRTAREQRTERKTTNTSDKRSGDKGSELTTRPTFDRTGRTHPALTRDWGQISNSPDPNPKGRKL